MSLVACGSSEEKKEDTTQTATESKDTTDNTEAAGTDMSILKGKKISFMTAQAKFSEEYNGMAAMMKEKYGCDVEFQVVPDNEYYSLLKVKLSTSEVPDVFEYNMPGQNVEIGVADYCLDLSNEPWVSRLENPDLIKDNGKIYGLPKESSSTFLAVYYNKEVLKNCGITDPHPKTYNEFLDILKTVKEKGNGTTPLYMTNADTWTTQIFMGSGFPVTLGDKSTETWKALLENKIKWTEIPECQEVLTNFVNLIKDGYVNKDHLSVGYDTVPEAIGTGKAAMYIIHEPGVQEIRTKYPDLEIGAFVLPYGDHDILPIGSFVQGLAIPKEGKQTDVVKAFLNGWSDPEVQAVYYKTKPGFPGFSDVDGGDVEPCVQKLVDEYVKTGKYVYQINDEMPQCGTLWADLWSYYVEAAAETKTPSAVFETFQKQYVDFMEQQGAAGF